VKKREPPSKTTYRKKKNKPNWPIYIHGCGLQTQKNCGGKEKQGLRRGGASERRCLAFYTQKKESHTVGKVGGKKPRKQQREMGVEKKKGEDRSPACAEP